MIGQLFRSSVSLLLCLSFIYTPAIFAQGNQLSLPSGDLAAPEIHEAEINAEVQEGKPIKVAVTVIDNVGVLSVVLFYRAKGATGDYNRASMQKQANSDIYSVELNDIPDPGIEYYIQATDLAGNTLLYGHSFSPLSIAVIPVAPAVTVEDDLASNSKAALSATERNVQVKVQDVMEKPFEESSSSKMKWVWIGLGILAVGALASAGGGGGDDGNPSGSPSGNTSSATITAPTP